MFLGATNEAYTSAGREFVERFKSNELMDIFKQMVSDWTIEGYDPFAAPMETGAPWGVKNGDNDRAVSRTRVTARRMVGLKGDTPIRTNQNGFPVNRMFDDVKQDAPEVYPEPGFEHEVSAFNLFAYLSRSDVTWNPSVCSVVKDSLFCPTSEEYILPVEHGNDRCEWFVTLSDEIIWNVKDGKTGRPKAVVRQRAGDCACMPADIRHQGFSAKRAMLRLGERLSEGPGSHSRGQGAERGRVVLRPAGQAGTERKPELRSRSRGNCRGAEDFQRHADETLHQRKLRRRFRRCDDPGGKSLRQFRDL